MTKKSCFGEQHIKQVVRGFFCGVQTLDAGRVHSNFSKRSLSTHFHVFSTNRHMPVTKKASENQKNVQDYKSSFLFIFSPRLTDDPSAASHRKLLYHRLYQAVNPQPLGSWLASIAA
jgi:hypothetical protein